MTRYNKPTAQPAAQSPIQTESFPIRRTHEGAPGYARDPRSELFLLAVSHFGDKSFYESYAKRNDRFVSLLTEVAVLDPEWTGKFVPWLRDKAGMRTASVVAAVQAAGAQLGAAIPGSRSIIADTPQLAEEPGEFLAYLASIYGRRIPKPFKRGLADAVTRLYNEYAALKYDTASHGYRFADVLEFCHPKGTPEQDALFRWIVDRRHGHKSKPATLALLPMVQAERALRRDAQADPRALLDTDRLRAAGFTWEDAKSLAGQAPKNQRPSDAALWAALIPTMGLLAQVRNLRNFDDVGVSDADAQPVIRRLAELETVRKSRIMPFQFLAAYRAVSNLRWSYPLEQAINHSLFNVPYLRGTTLVLVDRSPSMWDQNMSEHSTMSWADAAAVFGVALAARAESATLVEFGIPNAEVKFRKGESVLKIVERFSRYSGTDIPTALRRHYAGHDRVAIVTDEQTRPGTLPTNRNGYSVEYEPVDSCMPADIPLYLWNFGGYEQGAVPTGTGGNRHAFGGLNDASFGFIQMLETRRQAKWPWEAAADLG